MHKHIILNNGLTMPIVGFGTWMLKGEAGKRAVLDALAVGYRLIDTAHMYDNEAMVGQAVAESGLRREDIFITTKLCQTRAGYELAWGRALKNRWLVCRPIISICCSSTSLMTRLWTCIGP